LLIVSTIFHPTQNEKEDVMRKSNAILLTILSLITAGFGGVISYYEYQSKSSAQETTSQISVQEPASQETTSLDAIHEFTMQEATIPVVIHTPTRVLTD
jgi:hypothetical protein